MTESNTGDWPCWYPHPDWYRWNPYYQAQDWSFRDPVQGWQCPRCLKCYSPTVESCSCSVTTVTTVVTAKETA